MHTTSFNKVNMFVQEAQKLIKTLKEIGLTASEANTYLTLFSIGANPASTIAKAAELNRCTCYTNLKNLLTKGLIHQTIKNNVTYFTAVEPQFILDLLKVKNSQQEENVANLIHSLEDFELLKNSYHKKPKVIFYEGKNGVKNIMEKTLTSKGTIRAYACLDGLTCLLPVYFQTYYKRRTKKGIKVKAIYPVSKNSYLHKLRDKEELRESRLIPEEFNFHLDILIFDNKVAITSIKEQFGVLIESEDMAKAQKDFFDLIWKSTKAYDEIMTNRMKKKIEKSKGKCKTHDICCCSVA